MGNLAAQRPWVHNRRIAKPGEHEGQGENELSLINWQDFVGENLCIDQRIFSYTNLRKKQICNQIFRNTSLTSWEP